ncbi:MAG: glycerol-3-phosphate acyltransferase [Chloroflexota bacterium]
MSGITAGSIAIVLGYLLGAIPVAYIVTRLLTGKDIRTIDGGNAGARNVFVNVNKAAGIGVGVFDFGKGFIAASLPYFLTRFFNPSPQFLLEFAMAAGLAAVAGHIWPVYLKFTGGNGLATALGVLSILMTRELFIVFALALLLLLFTHNPIFSVNISLLTVPITGGLLEKSWYFVVFPLVLMGIMLVHFGPVIMKDFAQAGGVKKFFAKLFRLDQPKKKKKTKTS